MKKEKNKKNSLLYNIKTPEDKTERNLNEGKFGLKLFFQERENNGAFNQALQNIRVSGRSSFQVYDYSKLNCEYFADLYCYVRKYF